MNKRNFFTNLERIYNVVLIFLTICMFITVTYNVFMRFVMNQSVGWADELSRFLFIWTSFIGAVIAYRNDEHVGLSFVIDLIKSRKIQQALAILRQILIIMLLGLLTYFGYKASTTVMNVSPALSIPMSIIYLIVPFCGALMVLIGLGKLAALISGKQEKHGARISVE